MSDLSKVKNNESGFTLLELLVVVTILAIIGGGLIGAFSGKETQAAQGTATNAIAGVQDAFQIFQVTEQKLPSNLESLACAPFDAEDTTDWSEVTAYNDTTSVVTAGVTTTEAYKFGGASNVPGIGGGMGLKLSDKFILASLDGTENGITIPAGTAEALSDAGILELRYAVTAACDNVDTTTETVAVGTVSAALGADNLIDLDIPNQAFEDPRPNSGGTAWQNRGRGFSAPVLAGAPVLVWDEGLDGYNNKKVGAAEGDILIGFGVGESSELVGASGEGLLAKAPFYGQVGKDKYAHYIALVNISQGDPFVQAVLDARGDFLDEEIAEFQGQKQ